MIGAMQMVNACLGLGGLARPRSGPRARGLHRIHSIAAQLVPCQRARRRGHADRQGWTQQGRL